MKNIIDSIAREHTHFGSIRKEIHANPELCFEERDTAKLVANELTRMGIPVVTGFGKTGVIGIVEGLLGKSEKAIGLRADMDA